MCGLELKELARESGLAAYAGVAMAVKRYEALRDRDPVEQACFRQVVELLNVKMCPEDTSPGSLATFRRDFESAPCWDADSASFLD